MKRILIKLPKDRRQPGTLSVLERDAVILAGIDCRGKADNGTAKARGNPERVCILPYGDTPSGAWHGCEVAHFAKPVDGLGKAWIALERPWSGDAVNALIHGRTGLGIHGGRGNGDLVATKGCIRVRDNDFALIVDALGLDEFIVEIIDTEPAASGDRKEQST